MTEDEAVRKARQVKSVAENREHENMTDKDVEVLL